MFMPFNLAFHAFMIGEGATHERIKEFVEDIGCEGSGSKLHKHAAHDIYTLDEIEYVVFEDGSTDRC